MSLKKRKPVVNPAPYMNKELRLAIYKKECIIIRPPAVLS
jgi:hypothetical protein